MEALKNIDRHNYKNEDVRKLIKLYTFKGKEFWYESQLANDINLIKKQLVVKNCYSLVKYFKLDISDKRLKLLLIKDSKPKNKEEQLVHNMKQVLTISANQGHNFELITNEIVLMANKLFDNIKKVKISTSTVDYNDNLLVMQRTVSKRNEIDELFNRYQDLLASEDYEIVTLIINFYIDFINIKPLTEDNEMVALFIMNNMLLREHFDINMYESFFEELLLHQQEFEKMTVEASYNYKDGYPRTEELTRLIVDILIKNYEKLELMLRDYQYDNKLNKTDNIENTIYRLPQTFTKEDIRKLHPYVSESTINRTLKKLKEEGKINPLSTGRSASWIRITEGPERFNINGQLDIFEVLKNEN